MAPLEVERARLADAEDKLAVAQAEIARQRTQEALKGAYRELAALDPNAPQLPPALNPGE